jgi:GH25 family lysozyme M1 (1,4-beta-N-acetylmuramidase)
MSEKPFGIDVSQHQGNMDWEVVAAYSPKVCFAGIRAGISWGYVDKNFKYNWSEARKVGIARTAYHVIYPDSPPQKQMESFVNLMDGDFGELPPTIDAELTRDRGYAVIASVLIQCLSLLENMTGIRPMIYTRANWIDEHITGPCNQPPSWLNAYDYWLAQYLRRPEEHSGPPDLPRGVDRKRCIIHQTSERGAPIGSEARQQDYNRWQGDLDSFYAYANILPAEENVEEPPPSELTLEERVTAIEEAARKQGWSV